MKVWIASLMCVLWGLSAMAQNTQPVAGVFLQKSTLQGFGQWEVQDSTRYYYYPTGDYQKIESFCFDETNGKYYLCGRTEYYIGGDTSIVTLYYYNPATLSLEYNNCYFTRVDANGRTLESGSCYNPSGCNYSYNRTYNTYDTLGRVKTYRYARWSDLLQRLSTTVYTDYYYDTLGYNTYVVEQTYANGSFYLSRISWDSTDVANNSTIRTVTGRILPTDPWDTLSVYIEKNDTVGNIAISTRYLQDNVGGNLVDKSLDSIYTDMAANTIRLVSLYRNDTVQQLQYLREEYQEKDAHGNITRYISKYAQYPGGPLLLQNEGTNTFDSLNRYVYRQYSYYAYNTGVLQQTGEQYFEYGLPAGDSTYNQTTTSIFFASNGYTEQSRWVDYHDSLSRDVESFTYNFDTVNQVWQPVRWLYYYYNEHDLVGIATPPSKGNGQLALYPNPTTGEAFMDVLAPQPSVATMRVYDLTGRLLLEESTYLQAGPNSIAMGQSLAKLLGGLYIVKLSTPTIEHTGKIMYQP